MKPNGNSCGQPGAGRILVVDDETTALKSLRRILEKEGHTVSTYSNPVRALQRLRTEPFDIVLSDLRMPHLDGLELLDLVKKVAPEVAVIIITGYASLAGAVDATKKGAFDFLAKPFTPQEVRDKVAQALRQKQAHDQARELIPPGPKQDQGHLIIGQSPQMLRLAETVAQIAPTDCNVLITGESGTGKELAARAIHDQSRRAAGAWVAFNCAAFNRELMENELFGHEKGAFTGAHQAKAGLLEIAQGGTVFLDEIGEMPPAMQVKLLRALQEREVLRVGATRPRAVDMRVLAATARDLKTDADAGVFRRDLFYRLNVVSLNLPRLSERRGDIPLLVYHFLEKFKRDMDKSIDGISSEALALLSNYAYPGNVRELRNIMERAVALCRSEMIQTRDLPSDLASVELASFAKTGGRSPSLDQMEKEYIRDVLHKAGGVRTTAAEILGIDRVSLWRKMKKYGLK